MHVVCPHLLLPIFTLIIGAILIQLPDKLQLIFALRSGATVSWQTFWPILICRSKLFLHAVLCSAVQIRLCINYKLSLPLHVAFPHFGHVVLKHMFAVLSCVGRWLWSLAVRVPRCRCRSLWRVFRGRSILYTARHLRGNSTSDDVADSIDML